MKQNGANEHKLVLVPAGEYVIGKKGHSFNPLRKVSLKSYRIADAETTNAQFEKFVRKTNYISAAEKMGFSLVFRKESPEWQWNNSKTATWRFPQGKDWPFTAEKHLDHPVTQISAADAEAYCKWVGGRLPTQAEWEVAARAGATTLFPWGAEFDPKKANIWNGRTHKDDKSLDGFELTSPVRSFPPNAWGLYDVIGNVFEYTADLPASVKQRKRKLTSARGGSWWCSSGTCNFYNLIDTGTMDRFGSLPNQGFRVVFDPEP